jgi:hypothetical protein
MERAKGIEGTPLCYSSGVRTTVKDLEFLSPSPHNLCGSGVNKIMMIYT